MRKSVRNLLLGAGAAAAVVATYLVVQNRLEEGVRHLQKALELTPDSPEVYFNLGVAAFRRGDG